MSRRKTERLLSLVVCLLSARRYLTATQIREAVPGYPDSFEAFKRMFERDKDELRELGIPLETGTNAAGDEEAGYRISRQAYELPDIRLEPDEVAVLGLAARVWRRAELAGAAEGRAAQAAGGGHRRGGPQPAGDRAAGADARGGVRAAVGGRPGPAPGRFRLPGRWPQCGAAPQPASRGAWSTAAAAGTSSARTPTGEAERVFRLSRIDGAVSFTGPAGLGHGAARHGRAGGRTRLGQRGRPRRARCELRVAVGRRLRPAPARAAHRAGPDVPGWDVVELSYSDTGWWSEHVASFGADVVVLEPTDLRDAVIGRLKGVLA